MLQHLLEIIIICLLLYVGYLGKFYLPSYFKRKAENLAQSQDIEQLTRLVKEVEFKFEERTQNLKAKLDLTNQLQLGLHNEERTSLISLHNKILEYYNFLADVTFGGIDFKDYIAINNRMAQRSTLHDSLFVLKNNCMLFIENENEIEEIVMNIGTDFLEFTKIFINYCGELNKHSLTYKSNLSVSEIDIYYNTLEELNSTYAKNVSEFITIVAPKINHVTKSIKLYLNKRIK
ncbi:hypothetical protein J0383_02525 [Flavobacterium endoglycinae]|uniref:Uncharacterized protein n=1 Tax=Flavobacterium endoglycinae TaxID=2816357 RepID=A0ABX7QGE1_9FLAO|nr:hypothetical protein [Flavobacterium endoglycinae]QSW89698.1 hypothetical protein J0383_02525 [Flavobacterium endoglycinae]